MTVDLERLRALYAARNTAGGDAIRDAIVGLMPTVLDELESLRAEVDYYHKLDEEKL